MWLCCKSSKHKQGTFTQSLNPQHGRAWGADVHAGKAEHSSSPCFLKLLVGLSTVELGQGHPLQKYSAHSAAMAVSLLCRVPPLLVAACLTPPWLVG